MLTDLSVNGVLSKETLVGDGVGEAEGRCPGHNIFQIPLF